MLGVSSAFLLLAGFQAITAQGPPPFPPNLPAECRGPPTGVQEKPFECCKVPKLFNEEDFKECGFEKMSGPHPKGPPPDCSKTLCMFKKNNFLKNDAVDKDAVRAHLEKFTENDESVRPSIDAAVARCLGDEVPGPPHACEADRVGFCVTSTMFAECTAWEQSEGCQKLKEHLDFCRPFFPKHP